VTDKVYGKVIRTYRGKGKLKLANGNELPCHITIHQIETGAIYITCNLAAKVAQTTSTSQFIMSIMNFSAQEIEYVYGKTNDGMSFKSQEKLYTIHANLALFSTKSSELRLLAQEVDFWPENKCHAKRYEFSVVNLEFLGNHPVQKTIIEDSRKTEHIYLDLQLETPWGIAEIDRVADYDSVISKIKAQKGISVTCTLLVKPTVHMELKSVIAKVDELCKLLSLARGTKINWINAQSYTQADKLCHTMLKNSIVWPFSHHSLIDPRNPNDTPFFIKKVYPAYLRRRDRYNLDIAIEQYLDAKRETAYLETRALAAVALIDSLQQQYASGHGLTEIVKGFGKQKNGVRECLKNFITSAFPNIKKRELDEILGKIPELNRRSFLNLLKKWMGDLGLQIPDSELSAIKDTRNSLAHRMCFKSSDKREKTREYFRLINLINQVFLKLLDYKGYFIHVNLKTLAFERRELE
jgi:hypothetical protein